MLPGQKIELLKKNEKPFGLMPEELQKEAWSMPREFEYYVYQQIDSPTPAWFKNPSTTFSLDKTYRLRPDYTDKPKEPEYEYMEIMPNSSYYVVWPTDMDYMPASTAPSLIGFLGYAKTKDQMDNFQQTFTADMKYVVLKKG